ncbi:hypothetical protein H4Q26_011875 [Puccinia striiformis f. sp. tritici PST-130]|nr:hypothetical protein H4Q26_011875 [Puccinia striiformis f. sp. tritici PST-130]
MAANPTATAANATNLTNQNQHNNLAEAKKCPILSNDDNFIFENFDDESLPINSLPDAIPQTEISNDSSPIDLEDSNEDFQDAISSSNSDSDQDFASSLVPTQLNPSTRVLRERTSAIKPVKYSHLTTNCERKSSSSKPDDPKTFKSAMKHIDKRSNVLGIPQSEDPFTRFLLLQSPLMIFADL